MATTFINMSTQFMRGINTFKSTLDEKLEPPVKNHLKEVYKTLAMGTMAAAVGGYIQLFTGFIAVGFLVNLMFTIGALYCASKLFGTPAHDVKFAQTRLYYYLGFAGFTGLSLGPLLGLAVAVDPRTIPFAFISTCLVFGSFSLSAIFSNHRKWLYFGGTLASMFNALLLINLINLFVGSYFVFELQLYLGLILICVFVMYDTAYIIEKRRAGETDHILHSLILFGDFIRVFQRILIALIMKERGNNRGRNSRSSANSR